MPGASQNSSFTITECSPVGSGAQFEKYKANAMRGGGGDHKIVKKKKVRGPKKLVVYVTGIEHQLY